MKVTLALFLIVLGLSMVSAEIIPNFPGEQPIFFDGSSGNQAPTPPTIGESVDRTTIDSYSFETSPPVIVLLTESAPPAVTNSAFDQDPTTILGGERDIILTAETGNSNLVFSAGAAAGTFSVSTPNEGSGVVLLQYDGVDGSEDLDIQNGLNGFDLTDGDAVGFRIEARSDVDTEFVVGIFDSDGRSVFSQSEVLGGSEVQSYELFFEDFTGNLDFSSVNAIEFEIQAFDNVDFNLETFVTFSNIVPPPVLSGCFNGTIAPCLTNYYRLEELNDIQPGDYITITWEPQAEPVAPDSSAMFYLLHSDFDDLQEELQTNTNIISTLGGLPGASQFDYKCEEACKIEIVWSQLQDTTYYIAVEGFGPGFVSYEICLSRSEVPITRIFDREELFVFNDTRVVDPDDNVRHYSYFAINIPQDEYLEGTYLQVLLSRALPPTRYSLLLQHEGLPLFADDTGVIGAEDTNSRGVRVDDEIYPSCVPIDFLSEFVHPLSILNNIPCFCQSDFHEIRGSEQQSCQVIVDPCDFKYGTWYISVELPVLAEGQTSDYSILASVIRRDITQLAPFVEYSAQVDTSAMNHYRIDIPADSITIGDTRLMVKITDVRNGFVTGYIHQRQGNFDTLAGGLEGCSAANATCTTCASCNMVIEKCHFVPGTYYVSVGITHDDDLNFEVNDEDRLPINFSITALWGDDPTPEVLIAGVPVSKNIIEADYDFYVINVPATIDTMLYIELFAKANDTEVSLAVLHGDIPGGDCYARPDFYCLTGDVRGIRSSAGPTSFIDNEGIQRESCSYMIQACELTPGPLYISVYGHNTGYAAYGDNTFYGIPVEYTLYAEFDTPLALTSGISYSETVYEAQYQHYYMRVTEAVEGQWLSVEVTNIQHGVPQAIEAYVNYNFLAGDCPCYDSMFTCTQDSTCGLDTFDFTPNALPDIDSVRNCCTILVHPSDFLNGIWYVAVRGVNEDYFQYTTPIGYTLTVTIHDAPEFKFLPIGQHYQGLVPRWNRTHEYSHFRLAADAIPLNDLVLKLTWVQNCDNAEGGKHDDSWESVSLYVNYLRTAGANPTGHLYECTASDLTQSYCTIVIPHCMWLEGGYLLAVRGDYEADFDAQFTLVATSEEVRDVVLSENTPQYDRVHEGLYKHYYINTDAEEDSYLAIDVYTNQDQDPVTVYLNHDQRAGSAPCFTWTDSCHTDTCCSWQLKACELSPGRVYISVAGSDSHFYHVSTEFTIVAGHHPVQTHIFDHFPMTGHLSSIGDYIHYSFEVDQLVTGDALTFTVDGVKHGSVNVYSQFESLAGRCPCYLWEKACSTTEDKDWCQIRYAPCELHQGTYFFSVSAKERFAPGAAIFMTPIGFTAELRVETPTFGEIEADVTRQSEDTLSETLVSSRYRHYAFSWDDDDAQEGYHLIVEITNVRNGILEVYYNAVSPGDETCHDAVLCNGGVGSGAECFWQLPYCLTEPLDDPINHYISIYNADAGNRVAASYDILIWKQPVPTITENPFFTLDFADTEGLVFAPNQEFNVLHDVYNEPNGWTQFIKLPDVDLSLDPNGRGELLELFFYDITNNLDQPMSFNVYVAPLEPAGAHECCDTDRASCQGAPCSHSADTTTLVNQQERITHTCVLGNGIGTRNSDVTFGEQCTVSVWPCELSKYCNDDIPKTWFVSVVPIAPTCLSSEGPGLQYSFQWRLRNIRYADATQDIIGTVDLTDFVGLDEYTETFFLNSTTSESQGWRSFFVPHTDANTRLSIQTRFNTGSGTVYIDRDSFASAGPCHEYECTSAEGDCNFAQRFIVSECCGDKADDGYFVTIRNTGDPGEIVGFEFRIIVTPINPVLHLDDHPTIDDPFIALSSVSRENYDYYQLSIDDDDLEGDRSWLIFVDRIGTVEGDLDVYVRFGAPPGLYGAAIAQDFYGNEPEGCHSWQYTCNTDGIDDSCFFEIPACSMVEGHYYIAVHNPSPNLVPGENIVFPEYQLTTYITERATNLVLNEPLQVTHTGSVDALVNFRVNLTAQSGGFDDRNDVESYWSRYLRFQIDNISNDTTIEMWVNYDGPAGAGGEFTCLSALAKRDCDAVRGCYYDVLPCGTDGGFKLVTGEYTIALRLSQPASFQITTLILAEPYTVIEIDRVEDGVSQRSGTENAYWTYTASATELSEDGDGEGNYRYVIDLINIDGDDDDLIDNQYLIFNITAAANATSVAPVHMDVFRDDCTRFECDIEGPQSWCTIDALTLGPCALKGGRYYFDIFNPGRVEFTLDAYLNETIIVDIQDSQEITEFIFPYEYQEYFYEAHDVGQGATLAVNICAVCGQVEAWIRPDFPAGPTPDVTGEEDSCSIDYCATDGEKSLAFGDFDNANCCTMFLDTCEYAQRGYYVGIRGVSTSFPTLTNQILYLPAQYKINVEQTTVNFTEVYLDCNEIVSYYEPVDKVPSQFFIDVETINIGTQLRFQMNVYNNGTVPDFESTLSLQFNHSLGYSEQCQSSYSCSSSESCVITIPYCALSVFDAPRIYASVDAPRGTEIHFERSDPIVPVVHPDITYHSTINAASAVDGERSSSQIYRFDINPHDDDYSKFFVRVAVSNVQYGSVSFIVNSGQYPFAGEPCVEPLFFSGRDSCDANDEVCYIDIEWSDIQQPESSFLRSPRTFWLTVNGENQDCDRSSIAYDFVVQTNFAITYYPVGETICNEVHEGDYNFHRIRDSVEKPQQSFLRFTVEDLSPGDDASLLIQEGRLATISSSDLIDSNRNAADNIVVDYFCPYESLYVSVFGNEAAGNGTAINYRMSVEKAQLHIKELFDDSTYSADDDDDDACPHEHDFYRFALPSEHVSVIGSFFRVAVDSEFPTTVFVNRGGVAWSNCYNADGGSNDPRETGTTTINLYDFCDYDDTPYYITVISDGPYYIYTDVRDDPKELTVGEIFRDTLEPAMYQVYTLEICEDWFEADDRLVVEITDVEHGSVFGWIRYEGTPGSFNHNDESGVCWSDSAVANYGNAESGYDFLLVNSCELQAGTYQILIRAAPHPGSPERDCQHVNYRLYPYLIDYQIDPDVLLPNSVIHDAVDFYTVNRIEESSVEFINYYTLRPLEDADGYREQISHAVARLANVEGGLLRLRVMCDHLAIAEFGYFDGEIYGLNKASDNLLIPEWKMQSGRLPYTLQRMMDGRNSIYQPECDGCTDLCCEMTYDDIDEYKTDKSCAVWIPSCYLVWADLYLAVEPVVQYSQDHSIFYDLAIQQSADYASLVPNTQVVASFENDNWDYDFYQSVTEQTESMRWRVVVTDGEGVLVTVRNHRCPLQASWTKEIWCDAAYFDRPWMCDIEIPTYSAHPGTNYFFLSVYGKNVTYSLANWVGRENCHDFVGSGRNEGLDFCAGLVPYAVWRWDNYINLDHEAECFFTELYTRFQVQPCWSGVTPECNGTLAAFACYESFHRCDEFGFAQPTCRQACDSVVTECFNTFDAVDYEAYNCTSSRYGDGYSQTCTMSDTLLNEAFEMDAQMGNPDLLAFESSPSSYEDFSPLSYDTVVYGAESSSSATTLSTGYFFTLFMVSLIVLLF